MLQSHRRYGDPTWPDPLSALWYAAFFNAHHSDVGNTYTAANTHIRFIYLSFLSPTAFLHPSRSKGLHYIRFDNKSTNPTSVFFIWPAPFNFKQCNDKIWELGAHWPRSPSRRCLPYCHVSVRTTFPNSSAWSCPENNSATCSGRDRHSITRFSS